MKSKRLLAGVAVVTSTVLLATSAAATPAGTVDYVSTSGVAGVTLLAQGRDLQAPTTGQVVKFGAKLVAPTPKTVTQIIFACRTPTQTNCDFGHTNNQAIGTTVVVFEKSFTPAVSGTYTVWVAFNDAGTWRDLTPQMSVPVTAAPPPNPQPQGSTGGGYVISFQDEFSGTSVDTTKWAYQSSAEGQWCSSPFGTGNKSNHQQEFDQPGNATVSSGTLKILAKPQAITACGVNYTYTSTLLTTQGATPSFSTRFGWLEVSAKMPGPTGFWPAFWTWPVSGGSSADEVDVFEFYSDNHNAIYQTDHRGGGCITNPLGFDASTAFHTYGANIRSTGVDFYIDGVLKCHAAGVPAGNVNLLLDNFVSDGINAPAPAAGAQGTYEVDYARAWS